MVTPAVVVDDSVTVVVVVKGTAVVEDSVVVTLVCGAVVVTPAVVVDDSVTVVVVKGTAVVLLWGFSCCNTSLWCCCGNSCSSGG